MRYIDRLKKVLPSVALALLLTPSAIANSTTVFMTHPLFGNQFLPSEIRFPRVSSDVIRSLKLRKGRYWQFASYDARSEGKAQRFVLVAGISLSESGLTVEPDFGAVILLENGKYSIVGGPDDLAIPGKFSSRVQHGIYESAVNELVRAFGGIPQARAALCSQNVTVDVVGDTLYAIMSGRRLVCK